MQSIALFDKPSVEDIVLCRDAKDNWEMATSNRITYDLILLEGMCLCVCGCRA